MKKRVLLLLAIIFVIYFAALSIGCKVEEPKKLEEKAVEKPIETPNKTPAPPALTAKSAPAPAVPEPSVEEVNRRSPFGMHPALVIYPGYPKNPYEEAQDIGVKWHRPPVGVFWTLGQPDINDPSFDFRIFDLDFGSVPLGIHIMANIAPEVDIHQHRTKPGSYLPIDEDKYKVFVKAVVERYNGDGKNDMPGLRNPILHWQVGNEPSAVMKRDAAKLQLMTYNSIKDACPECSVLLGGTAHPILPILRREGNFETSVEQYFRWFERDYEPILKELNGRYIDIFDFHWYGKAGGDYKKIKPIYERIKSLLRKYHYHRIPIWITEMGAYSGTPAPSGPLRHFAFQTEKQQAEDTIRRFVFCLAIGIKKIFPAFGLMEGFMGDDGYFDHTGFIYDGRGTNDLGWGVKKLSYYTYKKMAEILEGSDWEKTETIQEKDDIYIYKFNKSGRPIWVAWNDGKESKTIRMTLTEGFKNAKIIEGVPKYEFGKNVIHYDTAFNEIKWKWIEDNPRKIEFVLGDFPVYISEK